MSLISSIDAPAASASPPRGAGASPRFSRATWLGFTVVIAASVMDLLDSTITQTAAPAIRRALGGALTDLQWLTAAYTLALSAAMLLASRLGDRFGRRRMLLSGIAGFIVTSALCALAPSTPLLIAARALQGITAALMLPQGFGLIRELFGDGGQQRAFAIFGPVMGMAAVLGPIVGGGLVNLNVFGTGWRAIFLVNVPLGLVALVIGRRSLPRDGHADRRVRLDGLSVLLSAVIGVGLVYPLVTGRQDGWPLWCFGLLGASAAAAGALVLHLRGQVRKGRSPLVEPSILRRRPYVMGLLVVLFFMGALGGITLALNVMYQVGLGFSPLGSGVATVAIPLAAIPGSIMSSVLLPKIGRTTMHLGLVTMAIGLGVVALVLGAAGGSLTAWELVAPLVLTGFGMGQVFVPMFDVILAGVAPHQIGSASGLLESMQQLAMSLGIAIVGTVMFDNLDGARSRAGVFVHGAQAGVLVSTVALVLAAVAVCWLPKHARDSGGH